MYVHTYMHPWLESRDLSLLTQLAHSEYATVTLIQAQRSGARHGYRRLRCKILSQILSSTEPPGWQAGEQVGGKMNFLAKTITSLESRLDSVLLGEQEQAAPKKAAGLAAERKSTDQASGNGTPPPSSSSGGHEPLTVELWFQLKLHLRLPPVELAHLRHHSPGQQHPVAEGAN